MRNSELLQRSLDAVWHPCTQMKQHLGTAHGGQPELPLVPIRRGAGVWLYDFDGARYLDAISSWWVNLFGHGNARINAALRDQLDRLEHVLLAGFTHEPVVELSERLAALTGEPGKRLGHAFYASDGASATEIALKMSFHAWRNSGRGEKNTFLCLEGSYHGETVGALAVTDVALFKDAYAPLVRAAATVPSPDARRARDGQSAADVARDAAAALEAHLAENHRHIAALIVEPLIQCASGMAMYDPDYLRHARALCDRYEVHLICDEIAVGCGRTGTFFAHEQAGIRPDLLCLSKGISGGYLPLSIVLCSDAIYGAFYDDAVTRGFLHSHSYTGNALACRAALATLDIFRDDDVIAANRTLAAHLGACLAPLGAHPRVRHLRQRGLIAAFDVDADPGFSRRYYRAALDREVLLRPIGNTVYFMPPYVISPDECAFLVQRAGEALDAARAMTGDHLGEQLADALDALECEGLRRRRRTLDAPCGPLAVIDGRDVVSFCSNDYLGLANDPALVEAACAGAHAWGVGSGASHLVSGHQRPHETLETKLAGHTGFARALLFSTGYMANLGIVTALVGRGDAVFADKLNHASLIDAVQLSRADSQRYAHADLDALERLLASSQARRKLIVSDAVFSMDGDLAPLPGLLDLAQRHNAWLVVDDAHGFGVLGERGRGTLAHFDIDPQTPNLVYMGTLGKAAGASGAFVAASETTIDWLLQRARTYIFTTGSSPLIACALATSVELIAAGDWRRARLRELAAQLRDGLADSRWQLMPSQSAIQPVLIGDNHAALRVADGLFARGLWVPAIRPPTVPRGSARLRVSLCATHTPEQVGALVDALRELA